MLPRPPKRNPPQCCLHSIYGANFDTRVNNGTHSTHEAKNSLYVRVSIAQEQ